MYQHAHCLLTARFLSSSLNSNRESEAGMPLLLCSHQPLRVTHGSRHGIDRPRNIVQTLAFLSKDVRSRDELQYDLSNKYADGKEDDDR
ncbi:uncharacterized protein CCOS01_00852 [Colletotrichum costaricense]|uniref:Uncharacterized protein n=1 Tax=Colletotrichum costaricense TaxID=1209916 RepID=A0AAJ0E8D7_9PEZI|nr:uncharacterized protein CCOS01_00852 [Colletotrichum costaricense]KAK1539538.1 hypothetical protein CCOS01_00852 [Colletotrichum costaricense]